MNEPTRQALHATIMLWEKNYAITDPADFDNTSFPLYTLMRSFNDGARLDCLSCPVYAKVGSVSCGIATKHPYGAALMTAYDTQFKWAFGLIRGEDVSIYKTMYKDAVTKIIQYLKAI